MTQSERPLNAFLQRSQHVSPRLWRGRVVDVTGNLIVSEGPFSCLGEACEIVTASDCNLAGEVVGFRGAKVLSMALDAPDGVRFGDAILARGTRPSIGCGEEFLGRVIDALGQPLDDRGPIRESVRASTERDAPLPLQRVPIREPLGCGVRAIDGFISCGKGQRLGIFGGSGVGKSTLLGMMLRGTAADVAVLALVGERGREVGEFLEVLGEEGRSRSVIVVSTSDQSPLLRMRAALAATTIAEQFAAQGRNVLLVVDSLTRFAMAQREVGLAAGEPPTAKGYTPSVLSKLAKLVERAGAFQRGSITAFYTVLMEGDDQQDPVVDAVRSLLDGHVMLDRSLATRGHYPPIAVLDSVSRLMSSVASSAHVRKGQELLELLAAYQRSEDLLRIGAYVRGSDPLLDRAIGAMPALNEFLRQPPDAPLEFATAVSSLMEVPS